MIKIIVCESLLSFLEYIKVIFDYMLLSAYQIMYLYFMCAEFSKGIYFDILLEKGSYLELVNQLNVLLPHNMMHGIQKISHPDNTTFLLLPQRLYK